ncbi:MAG: TonB-dependent receptor [Deltaproteobacteria bacterium]|nr:TonB-dependent receptor [Deltaproteobacteria bacterium]
MTTKADESDDADFEAESGDELTDEFAFLEEGAVVESASRHRQETGLSPSAITVITREDIEASGATTLADLLRLVPGMDVLIGSPILTSIVARLGLDDENNYFLILVDGREVNLELLGLALLEVQIFSLDDIERIEVIRGPGSFLYGANALAGVVSITTRAIPESTSGWATMSGGEIGSMSTGVRASTRLGDWGFSLSGGFDTSGRFHDPHTLGREVWKLRAVAEYTWSETERILVDGGITQAEGVVTAGLGEFHALIKTRSLRLAYDSKSIRAQLYWNHIPGSGRLRAPLNFAGINLATIKPWGFDGHTINGEAQWMLPSFYEPLLIIVGGVGRASYLGSDELLDAESYSDISSTRYHEPGISHWEGRVGAFVHAEYSPADWVTLNGDLRADYNSVTGDFLSPRLAVVFRPADTHFLRAGVARSFRKPAFIETHAHMNVDFPSDSPMTTAASQEAFREFMTRGIGNSNLTNEKLLSFETGYRGEFLEKRLSVSLDIYFNIYSDRISIDEEIDLTPQGLPDLETSSFQFMNKPKADRHIIGSELAVRYSPSKYLSLLASWTYREEIRAREGTTDDETPQNMFILGGRFRTESGLVGSLYLFSRSEYMSGGIPSPEGMLADTSDEYIDTVFLILGKIGWQTSWEHNLKIETGLKLFLPVSPWQAPHFEYSETGSMTTLDGKHYGGDILRRMVTIYMQGSF